MKYGKGIKKPTNVGHNTPLVQLMVGDEGFEPPHVGVKVRCLTAWRIPNV